MSSYTKCVIAALVALAAIGVLMVAVASGQGAGQLGRCFPAAKWGPAPDAVRPCVKVTRIYEDGSFAFKVSDADGVVRYTSGVGALDR